MRPPGELLDHAGGHVDPMRVVSRIPPAMRVERLRERLVKIISDFRAQVGRRGRGAGGQAGDQPSDGRIAVGGLLGLGGGARKVAAVCARR